MTSSRRIRIPQYAPFQFAERTPSVIVVDDFFRNPDEVRALALAQVGSRLRPAIFQRPPQQVSVLVASTPGEEFELASGSSGHRMARTRSEWSVSADQPRRPTGMASRLTGLPQPRHTSLQTHRQGSGTSFWRDRQYGCRRRPTHALESERLGSEQAVQAAAAVIYDQYNIEHADNWELIESVAVASTTDSSFGTPALSTRQRPTQTSPRAVLRPPAWCSCSFSTRTSPDPEPQIWRKPPWRGPSLTAIKFAHTYEILCCSCHSVGKYVTSLLTWNRHASSVANLA